MSNHLDFTSCLQVGQSDFTLTQGIMHSLWNVWKQGSLMIVSPSSFSFVQIVQISTSSCYPLL